MEESKVLKYYKRLYRYTVAEPLVIKTDIIGQACRLDGQGELTTDGWLTVGAGFECDGPSGPLGDFDDSPDFMAGAVAHDWLYKAMREGKLGQDARDAADVLLYNVCRRAGMSWARAKFVLWCVRTFAAYAAKPSAETVYEAKAA